MLGAIACTGCSLALSGPDANRRVSEPPECDTGKGLVGLDGVMGGTLAVTTLGLAANNEGTAALITGLFGAAFIGAAIHGNSEVNECRQALAEYSGRGGGPSLDEPRVAAKPGPPPRRTTQPPTVMRQPDDPFSDQPPYQAPHANPAIPPPAPPAPPVATKPVAPPPVARPNTPTPPPAPPIQAEEPSDWKDFWTEVP